jgi:PIN domain nuclease of toxin-antitoxin system
LIVLDTHAWVWWLGAPERLSKKARAEIDQAADQHSAFVSSISAWEVAFLVERGRLDLAMPVERWLRKAESVAGVEFVPVDNDVGVRSVRLPEYRHSDPADRMILATAMRLGAQVVSRDRRMADYPHVKTIW